MMKVPLISAKSRIQTDKNKQRQPPSKDVPIALSTPTSLAKNPSVQRARSLRRLRRLMSNRLNRIGQHLTAGVARDKQIPPDNFKQIRPYFSYLSGKQIRQIEVAFDFARQAHSGQERKDGSLYICHPMAACVILAQLRLDPATLMAALLHDVVEDCDDVSADVIKHRFGDQVAQIVIGVTKLKKLKKLREDDPNAEQAENFQKMIIAMANDMRVILVKLADRLHNMRTLGAKGSISRKRIARETLEIYAPIANRMGLDSIYRELQDLAFEQSYPYRAKVLKSAIYNEFTKREANLFRLRDEVKAYLKYHGIKADVSARLKNTYSIFCKMRARHARFAKVYDICGLRVIVEKNDQCYSCLGLVHGLYKPMPGRIKDFIALPKTNGYQSLHTTVIGPSGLMIEVQIRSRWMHNLAESGLAAHWLYKRKGSDSDLSDLEKRTSQWMNSLIELNRTSANAGELLEHVKTDLFSDSVFVFTPKGKIVNLPRGATMLDFAYGIHTDIGHHAKSAWINDEEVPLRTELRNGDQVRIDTNPMPTVTVASITYAKTARARSQIRHYLRHLEQEQLRDLGEHWLRQILMDLAPFEDENYANLTLPMLEKRLVSAGICRPGQVEVLFADIALGKINPMHVGLALLKKYHDNTNEATLVIQSANAPMMAFASCCFPIPDDRIVGLIKRGEGLTVHRVECKYGRQLMQTRKNIGLKENTVRQVPVDWAEKVEGLFVSRTIVKVTNHQGALAHISSTIAEQNCNIVGIQMRTSYAQTTLIVFDVLVDHRVTLGRLYKKLHALPSVKSVLRFRE